MSLGSTVSLQTLEFGSTATAYTIGGGTISFTNAGTATILVNPNTASPAQIINSGITLNGALAVTNNSSNTISFGGTVSGASQTLSLSSGQTTTFSGSVNLGTLVKNGAGTLTFSGSTVAFATALTLNAGTTNIDTTATSTIANNITGAGNIAKNSASTLIFTGSNSYGTTTITAGTLQVGNNGTSGTLGSGAVTNNATLAFSRSDGTTVANDISGSGNLTKSGAGTMTYTGAGSYLGTTTISAGTLQVGNGGSTGSLGSGTVTNNAALIFNRSDATTVANNISGSGNLTKSGAGTLTYTGAGTYTGTTAINAGTLAVNNSLSTGGLVSVNSGGTLAGSGTVARAITVNNGGVIRGGDVGSIGTLNITGTTTVLGGPGNGGQITVLVDSTPPSGGAGTVLNPFVLTSNSQLALGNSGILNLDPNGGKFRIFVENDAALAQFTTYELVLATANAGTQFQRAGDGSAAFTSADFEVFGPSSANPFTDIQLTRTGNNLILTFTTVPEPGLMLGLGAGVLALGAFLRKRFA